MDFKTAVRPSFAIGAGMHVDVDEGFCGLISREGMMAGGDIRDETDVRYAGQEKVKRLRR